MSTGIDIDVNTILACHCGKPALSPLEQAICWRGLLRDARSDHRRHGNTSHIQAGVLDQINSYYGTHFNRHQPALAFMEVKVLEAEQAARDRAATYREGT